MQRLRLREFGPLRFGPMRPVSPGAVPRSRGTYQRSTPSSGFFTAYSVLLSFFKSELSKIIKITSNPWYGFVATKGFCCHDQWPSSLSDLSCRRNRPPGSVGEPAASTIVTDGRKYQCGGGY